MTKIRSTNKLTPTAIAIVSDTPPVNKRNRKKEMITPSKPTKETSVIYQFFIIIVLKITQLLKIQLQMYTDYTTFIK